MFRSKFFLKVFYKWLKSRERATVEQTVKWSARVLTLCLYPMYRNNNQAGNNNYLKVGITLPIPLIIGGQGPYRPKTNIGTIRRSSMYYV